MGVSFQGVGQVCATFLGSGLSRGQIVKISGRGTVAACSDGDRFCGAAVCCRDDACSVQVGGFVTAGYSGNAPGVGWTALCADGSGGVRVLKAGETGGAAYLLADVDTAAKTVTFML